MERAQSFPPPKRGQSLLQTQSLRSVRGERKAPARRGKRKTVKKSGPSRATRSQDLLQQAAFHPQDLERLIHTTIPLETGVRMPRNASRTQYLHESLALCSKARTRRDIHLQLGHGREEERDWQGAIYHYLHALWLQRGDDPVTLYLLGTAYGRLGQVADMKAALQAAFETTVPKKTKPSPVPAKVVNVHQFCTLKMPSLPEESETEDATWGSDTLL